MLVCIKLNNDAVLTCKGCMTSSAMEDKHVWSVSMDLKGDSRGIPEGSILEFCWRERVKPWNPQTEGFSATC
jgi:hypothetical protein